MHLEQIKYFLTLSKVLNFTKTAEMLYVTQPTISRQIRLMEDELGVKLFYRSVNSIHLTPAGTLLFDKLSIAYKTITDAIEEAVASDRKKEGLLRIGTPFSIGYDDFILQCHHMFKDQFPNVTFYYEKTDFLTLKEKLETDELDVVFTLMSEPYHAYQTNSVTLFEATGVLVFKKGDPRAKLCTNDIFSPFSGDDLVCLTEDISARGLDGLAHICESIGLRYRHAIRVPNLTSILFYIEAGLGFAILDKSVVEINNGKFDYIDLPNEYAKLWGEMAFKRNSPNPYVTPFAHIVGQLKNHFKDLYV